MINYINKRKPINTISQKYRVDGKKRGYKRKLKP